MRYSLEMSTYHTSAPYEADTSAAHTSPFWLKMKNACRRGSVSVWWQPEACVRTEIMEVEVETARFRRAVVATASGTGSHQFTKRASWRNSGTWRSPHPRASLNSRAARLPIIYNIRLAVMKAAFIWVTIRGEAKHVVSTEY